MDGCGGGSGSGGSNRRHRREDDNRRDRKRRKYGHRSVSSEDSEDSDDRSRSPDVRRRLTARDRRREKRRNRHSYERRRGRRIYSDSDDAPLRRSRDREDGECGTTDSDDSVVFVPSADDGVTVSAECVQYEGETTRKEKSSVSFVWFLLIKPVFFLLSHISNCFVYDLQMWPPDILRRYALLCRKRIFRN